MLSANNGCVILESWDYGTGFTDKCTYTFGNYIDEVLLMMISGNNIYYGHDHLFSPVVAYIEHPVTHDYVPIERYEYNAYGKVTIYDDIFSSERTSSLFATPYYFTGRSKLGRQDLI